MVTLGSNWLVVAEVVSQGENDGSTSGYSDTANTNTASKQGNPGGSQVVGRGATRNGDLLL